MLDNVQTHNNSDNVQFQNATNPGGYQCDIYAWNEAINHGRDPRGQNGEAPDLNGISVDTWFDSFPDNRTNLPSSNTQGYIFYDWDNNETQDHVEFYMAGEGTDYTVMGTSGIEPPTPREYDSNIDANGRAATGTATYVPLPEL